METTYNDDDDDEGGAPADKLIPEWGVAADNQVVLAGLAVAVILALLVGWSAWRGDDSGTGLEDALGPVIGDAGQGGSDDGAASVGDGGAGDGSDSSAAGDGSTGDGAAVATDGDGEDDSDDAGTGDDGSGDDDGDDGSDDGSGATPTTGDPADTTTTERQTTTEPAPTIGDVQAAVDTVPGDITGRADGTIAVLTGFVANDAERRQAEGQAAEVEGITEVRNELVVLEPLVVEALAGAGVNGATAVGRGTSITVSGTIDTEDDRQGALDAAAAVAGVTEVIDDRLNVSVTAELNALPQVQFGYNSAEILPESFADLDRAAELLAAAGGVQIEVQGYTDVEGPEAANLDLSQRRADAVRSYLVGAGVDADTLSATGFGETTEFGQDLASNRVVRFQQTS